MFERNNVMRKSFSRRDFLKLAGTASVGAVLPSFFRYLQPVQPASDGHKNVLVVVFDAFSAYHISHLGYGRKTTPNIDKLAERAIVYHNHFAGANFSTPGTASLLTGVLPWKHRAINISDTVDKSYLNKNIFSAFNDYYRIAYSHNPLVTTFLDQFASNLNEYIPLDQLLITSDGFIDKLFRNDSDAATIGWSRVMKQGETGFSYSLFLWSLYSYYQDSKIRDLLPLFPLGLPAVRYDNYFTLEQAVDWLGAQVERIPRPFLGYFHFLPPHDPYRTRWDFFNHFQVNDLKRITKPPDIFTHSSGDAQYMEKNCKQYDEFILYVDDQFQKLMNGLDSSGLLKDTWVILTSDHGELFERSIVGHGDASLYQGVVRVPLMIFEPGRDTRTDIYSLTSAADVLPTLLYLAKGQSADWSEGTILPPFSTQSPDPDRKVYAMKIVDTVDNAPITVATLMQVKGDYKLIYYFGYDELPGKEHVELYNIAKDPEELYDLYPSEKNLGDELLMELKAKLAEMNKPYR
jgi:arylsulfatase A-like enzyme